jgi:hypothetical protein
VDAEEISGIVTAGAMVVDEFGFIFFVLKFLPEN